MSEDATTTGGASASSSMGSASAPNAGHHGSDSSDSGCALEEYAWVPHGLRPQQVRPHFFKWAILIGH